VLSPGAGRVSFAGPVAGRIVAVIDHGHGLRSTLEPLSSPVPVGTLVRARQPVALLGQLGSHCGGLACLHWGLLRGQDYLDPLSLLVPRWPILLPVTTAGPARWAPPGTRPDPSELTDPREGTRLPRAAPAVAQSPGRVSKPRHFSGRQRAPPDGSAGLLVDHQLPAASHVEGRRCRGAEPPEVSHGW
ncbi:MAG: hypothetical protein ACRC0L_12895, partial [Angustibacter sp.]